MQTPQRFAEPLLRLRGGELALLPELCHHGLYVRDAKAKLAQSRSHPLGDIEEVDAVGGGVLLSSDAPSTPGSTRKSLASPELCSSRRCSAR
jgi:hypothetical protein